MVALWPSPSYRLARHQTLSLPFLRLCFPSVPHGHGQASLTVEACTFSCTNYFNHLINFFVSGFFPCVQSPADTRITFLRPKSRPAVFQTPNQQGLSPDLLRAVEFRNTLSFLLMCFLPQAQAGTCVSPAGKESLGSRTGGNGQTVRV